LSFLVLKNFLTDGDDEVHVVDKEPETTKLMHSDFANTVYEMLSSDRLVVCYHQDHVDVAYEQEAIRQCVEQRFQAHFYPIEVPTDEEDEANYFQKLSSAMGVQASVKSSDKWKSIMKKRLKSTQVRVVFLFSNIADGNEALNVKMGKVIRSLKNDHSNFYALCIGRKDLAYLVHGNRTLSLLSIQRRNSFFL
jgi:hypothetical protein